MRAVVQVAGMVLLAVAAAALMFLAPTGSLEQTVAYVLLVEVPGVIALAMFAHLFIEVTT